MKSRVLNRQFSLADVGSQRLILPTMFAEGLAAMLENT